MDIINEAFEIVGFESIFDLPNSTDANDVKGGGSIPGQTANVDCYRAAGGAKLFEDHSSPDLTYPDHMSSRRFRASRTVYADICNKLEAKYDFF